ncbi:branched-chain amino acid transport system ATP-binding protein [Pseudoxanthobacter soli DSM 19599]|uniref:Branched-chain amino acid transport system ATP-binding protein n=1 Tax=Pseudoxanthobacter soli DSM 19599 TaxID=1123029 RepID=A0A1M7ZP72_9HYPH|nr:ABC transporter ATP-binding protein [Pseudoxanthobacter soli]SHO66704.1 branched-chain amino acid transport system ATP-binding protein [Pseudoxanthobacter soli DSM 19599]
MSPDPAVPLLDVAGLDVYLGASHVLQGVSLRLPSGPLSIIGRNGMGKTTLCQAIMGLTPARAGRIALSGRDLAGQRPVRIARAGIGYVPQGRRVFPSLSVHEHLVLTAPRGHAAAGARWTIERVYDTFPRLAERRGNGGAQLSGGEQQMLAIARALLLNPVLLVMDEPTEGLAPVIVDHVVELLHTINREGVGLLLVEQNFSVAVSVAERVLVMVNGRIALETGADEIARNEDMQRRYLGVSAH